MTLYQAGDRLTVGANQAVKMTAKRRISPVNCTPLKAAMNGDAGEPAP